jgi:hypothetical protein
MQQGEKIRQRIGFDMGIAHEGVGVRMSHQALHAGHRFPHLQAPGGEGMPQGVQRQHGK